MLYPPPLLLTTTPQIWTLLQSLFLLVLISTRTQSRFLMPHALIPPMAALRYTDVESTFLTLKTAASVKEFYQDCIPLMMKIRQEFQQQPKRQQPHEEAWNPPNPSKKSSTTTPHLIPNSHQGWLSYSQKLPWVTIPLFHCLRDYDVTVRGRGLSDGRTSWSA